MGRRTEVFSRQSAVGSDGDGSNGVRLRRTAVLIGVIALAFGFALPVAAQDVAPVEPDAPVVEPDAPAEQTPEQKASEAEAKRRERVETARSRAAELFFSVNIRFKDLVPTEVKEMTQHYGFGATNNLALSHGMDKRAAKLDAALVDPAKGLFVMADPQLNLSRIAAITLDGKDGKTYPMRLVSVGRHCAAWALQAVGFKSSVPAPVFQKDLVAEGAVLMLARTSDHKQLRDISISGTRLNRYLGHGDDFVIFNLGGLPSNVISSWPVQTTILLDRDGAFGAVAVSSLLIRDAERASYVAQWPHEEAWLPVADLLKARQATVRAANDATIRMRLHFRQTQGTSRSGQRSASDWFNYGVIVDSRRIFLPYDLTHQQIAAIDAVLIQFPDGEKPGRFLGQYKEFGGLLIESPRDLKVPQDLWAGRALPDGDLFFDISVKQRFGRKDAFTKYNRFFGDKDGYKDVVFRGVTRPQIPGSLVFDREGRIYGFVTEQKRYENMFQMRQNQQAGANLRCFAFADYKGWFTEPAKHFDPRARVRDIQESKERAWLGVEYQLVTHPGLAREMGIEKETRDGRAGLFVTHVYKGSPAAGLGIKVGDILLTLSAAARSGEYDLGSSPGYAPKRTGRGRGYVRSQWFNRVNALTNILTTSIGIGQKAELTVAAKTEGAAGYVIRKLPFVVAKAWPDLRSAEKHKTEWAGLTVKPVTYEVRQLLRLADEFRGVVVYEVEGGSLAAAGRIRPLEFITEVDGQKVTSPKRFGELLAAALAAGHDSVKLTVRDLSESRIVHLKTSEQNGAEGE
jgi:hypothetical protein